MKQAVCRKFVQTDKALKTMIVEPLRVNFKQFSFPIPIVSYLLANQHLSPA